MPAARRFDLLRPNELSDVQIDPTGWDCSSRSLPNAWPSVIGTPVLPTRPGCSVDEPSEFRRTANKAHQTG
jgi:hypothetical protein